MRDAGLAYIKQEEGFKGTKGCFEMMASYEPNEFRFATSLNMAVSTGKIIRV
jgi:hypothetical protein